MSLDYSTIPITYGQRARLLATMTPAEWDGVLDTIRYEHGDQYWYSVSDRATLMAASTTTEFDDHVDVMRIAYGWPWVVTTLERTVLMAALTDTAWDTEMDVVRANHKASLPTTVQLRQKWPKDWDTQFTFGSELATHYYGLLGA